MSRYLSEAQITRLFGAVKTDLSWQLLFLTNLYEHIELIKFVHNFVYNFARYFVHCSCLYSLPMSLPIAHVFAYCSCLCLLLTALRDVSPLSKIDVLLHALPSQGRR